MALSPLICSHFRCCLTDLRVSSLTAGWGDTEDGDLGLCCPDPSSSLIFQAGSPTPVLELRLCFLLRGSLQAIGSQMLDI